MLRASANAKANESRYFVVAGVFGLLLLTRGCATGRSGVVGGPQPLSTMPSEPVPPGSIQAGPLICREPVHDFGTVWAGKTLEHVFEVQNAAPKPVWVEIIESAAITRQPWIEQIGPYANLRIPVCVNSLMVKGKFTKSFTVQLAEPPPNRR